MEEGEKKSIEDEEPLPPPPDDMNQPPPLEGTSKGDEGVKVNVLKPFKASPRVSRIVRQGKCFYHPEKPASYICNSCGKSICSVCTRNFSGVFMCPTCAPYVAPRTQLPSPATYTDNKSWYRALLAIGVVLLAIGLILALFYWPLASISAAEYENLQEQYWNDRGHNYKDYKPGDVIVIRDTIVRISDDHDPMYGVVTRIWFESTGKGDLDFSLLFDADLEKDYHVGDTVSITLHVEEDLGTRDEVIREYNNNLPNTSNIDHTISIDLIFFALILFGAFLVFLYALFMRKEKKLEIANGENQ